MSSVRALSEDAVRALSSGQVATDVAAAVKELVDNALDSGASTVDVVVFDGGVDGFEVADDGEGIRAADLEVVCKPHHTSKLATYSEIAAVSSLGFRGEGLSAVCASCRSFALVSRVDGEREAVHVVYDKSGNPTSTATKHRTVGTTAIADSLFSGAPVRRAELVKHKKRHVEKLIHMLRGYAVCRPRVRISVTDRDATGKARRVLSTTGSGNVMDVVVDVFGAALSRSLVVVADSDTVSGVVSAAGSSVGTPRQFLCINNRPIDDSKIVRAINAAFRAFNSAAISQKPSFFLNLRVDPRSVDVNVVPDKRKVFVENLPHVIAEVVAALEETWRVSSATFSQQQSVVRHGDVRDFMSSSGKRSADALGDDERDVARRKIAALSSFALEEDEEAEAPRAVEAPRTVEAPRMVAAPVLATTLSSFALNDSDSEDAAVPSSAPRAVEAAPAVARPTVAPDASLAAPVAPPQEALSSFSALASQQSSRPSLVPVSLASYPLIARLDVPASQEESQDVSPPPASVSLASSPLIAQQASPILAASSSQSQSQQPPSLPPASQRSSQPSSTSQHNTSSTQQISAAQSLAMPTKEQLHAFIAAESSQTQAPWEDVIAQDVVLDKLDFFTSTSIVGQFNKGFIITKIQNNLFILDQHACDEKANYEKLISNHSPIAQKLLLPITIEDSVLGSACVEHVGVIEFNGFRVRCGENHQITHVPRVFNKTYALEDLRELVESLNRGISTSDRTIMPSVLRAYASKACRSSVMVGTPLSTSKMSSIVAALSTLHQPWNCPHGRPTLRHLLSFTR